MRTPVLFIALSSGLLLAGCEGPSPNAANAGVEQLRSQLTPAMRRAGVSDECIQSLSSSTLANIKSFASVGLGPVVRPDEVGLTNPRRREEERIRTVVRQECPNL